MPMPFKKKKKPETGTFALVIAAFAVAGVATAVVAAPAMTAFLGSTDSGMEWSALQPASDDGTEQQREQLRSLIGQMERTLAEARALLEASGGTL